MRFVERPLSYIATIIDDSTTEDTFKDLYLEAYPDSDETVEAISWGGGWNVVCSADPSWSGRFVENELVYVTGGVFATLIPASAYVPYTDVYVEPPVATASEMTE
jgi:hypothetical protein